MVNQHYHSRYEKFIASLQGHRIDGYYELHHIVPRSLGGSNDKSNLIALTARQHYVAHWMLAKASGGSAARAFFMMSNFGRYGSVNSTTYEKARKEYSKLVSVQMKSRPPYVITEPTRQKMREAKLGKPLSESVKHKLSLAQVGRVYDDAFRQKVSESRRGKGNGRLGKTLPEETKRKIAESNINRPLIQCPYCSKIVKDHGGAKRWHFERCKMKEIKSNLMTATEAKEFIRTLP